MSGKRDYLHFLRKLRRGEVCDYGFFRHQKFVSQILARIAAIEK